MDDTMDIQIKLNSHPRYLAVVRAMVETTAQRLGFEPDQILPILLATDEAVCNVMRHGYKGATDQPIWIGLRQLQRNGQIGIEVVIEDRADVDPEQIKPRGFDRNRPGGLGVSIIYTAMDHVEYQRRDDQPGLRLCMTKYQAPGKTPDRPETHHHEH